MQMTDSEPSTAEPASPGDDPPPRNATLDLVDPSGLLTAAEHEWLCANAAAALDQLDKSGEARVRVVTDTEMDDAHRRYAGVPGTTDVLTFDLAQGDELDVDLLVCAEVAGRQASERGHDRAKELLLYVVHGLLHCVGYDDHDPDDSARMHQREDEILTAIGVGPVYGPEAGP